MCLAKIIFANLFYYSTYFYYYLWAPLHFFVLFMGLTLLFQLTFYLYQYYFQQKVFSFNKINKSQTDLIYNKRGNWDHNLAKDPNQCFWIWNIQPTAHAWVKLSNQDNCFHLEQEFMQQKNLKIQKYTNLKEEKGWLWRRSCCSPQIVYSRTVKLMIFIKSLPTFWNKKNKNNNNNKNNNHHHHHHQHHHQNQQPTANSN